MAADTRRSRFRLTSSDGDGVITLSDDRISFLSYHAQIARLQLEVNLLACAGIKMNALEAAKSDARRAFNGGKLEVELDDLISRHLAGVRDRSLGRSEALPLERAARAR